MSWYEVFKSEKSIPDLSSLPTPLTDDDVVGFGEFKDTKLCDVPISYYHWMVQTQIEHPRESRSHRWTLVMAWLRSKK